MQSYYMIDERAARTAHEMNSFRAFQEGRATADYQSQVDAAVEMTAERKKLVDPIYHDKIDALLDAYARKLAAWYNLHIPPRLDTRTAAIEQMERKN